MGGGMSEFAGLFRPESLRPFYTEERCHIVELLNTSLCEAVSYAQCNVAAGITTQLHRLKIDERYVIEQGQGRMEREGDDPATRQVFDVGVGDCVLIPAGCAQRIRNTGDVELQFKCICTPRFLPEHYVDLETDAKQEVTDIE